MEAPNQNPEINSKFKVGDTAYIHSNPNRYGKATILDAFFRIDGIGIREGDGIPIYNVTLLNGTPYGTGTVPITTLPISYLDSRATLKPAGSMRSAGPNGGRKSYRNLKKRKSRKTIKSRKTRRNQKSPKKKNIK
jgi:hypothetical protein